MITITKKYHFYAAHRNELIDDKCRSLHGHTYKVEVELEMSEPDYRTGITTLFSDIDAKIEPIIKEFDHALLLHHTDKLGKVIGKYSDENKADEQKILWFLEATSAENIANSILLSLKEEDLKVVRLSLSETESSTVTLRP